MQNQRKFSRTYAVLARVLLKLAVPMLFNSSCGKDSVQFTRLARVTLICNIYAVETLQESKDFQP